jgi:ABC-2 type transport system ATP-binding protein
MIRVEHLTKRYGSHPAVDDVSFTCEPGTVTGFLGPNGAGKSTTMRMICGLTPPTSGVATVGGVPYRRLGNPGRRVGVLLDASAQHGGRTGREVLVLAALTMGVDRREAGRALDRVGLNATAARRRVKRYSLGMRQRLGLAHALLGDPAVLILDEPANGLDPEGIRWMRDLLSGFAKQGRTVLVSSHLLSEVQLFADDVVIIAAGKLIRQGPVAELTDTDGMQQVRVRTPEPQKLLAELKAPGTAVQTEDDGALLVTGVPAAAVGHAALVAGIELHELSPQRADLERIFLELTSGKAGIR